AARDGHVDRIGLKVLVGIDRGSGVVHGNLVEIRAGRWQAVYGRDGEVDEEREAGARTQVRDVFERRDGVDARHERSGPRAGTDDDRAGVDALVRGLDLVCVDPLDAHVLAQYGAAVVAQ